MNSGGARTIRPQKKIIKKALFHNFLLFTVVLLAAIGCAENSAMERAGLTAPSLWSVGVSEPGEPGEPEPWLTDFNGAPGLGALVREALSGSYDLQAAAARVDAARALARVGGADRLPEAAIGFGAERSDYGDALTTVFPKGVMDLGAAIQWELDLWGKFRNQARAASFELKAGEAVFKAARLSLAVCTA